MDQHYYSVVWHHGSPRCSSEGTNRLDHSSWSIERVVLLCLLYASFESDRTRSHSWLLRATSCHGIAMATTMSWSIFIGIILWMSCQMIFIWYHHAVRSAWCWCVQAIERRSRLGSTLCLECCSWQRLAKRPCTSVVCLMRQYCAICGAIHRISLHSFSLDRSLNTNMSLPMYLVLF